MLRTYKDIAYEVNKSACNVIAFCKKEGFLPVIKKGGTCFFSEEDADKIVNGIKERARRKHGTVYLDTSSRDAHGRKTRHYEYCAEIVIKGKRYRYRSRIPGGAASMQAYYDCVRYIRDMCTKNGLEFNEDDYE